jgi:hypothetical protein
MKRLAILGFALAAFATPAHAQSQQKFDAPVYTFNGMVFDPPPVEHYGAPNSRSHRNVAPRMIESRSPATQGPRGFNGNIFD